MKKVILILCLFIVGLIDVYAGCWRYRSEANTGYMNPHWGTAAAYGDSLFMFQENPLYVRNDNQYGVGTIIWKTTDQGKTFSMYKGYLPDHPSIELDTLPVVGRWLCRSTKMQILNSDTLYFATDRQYLIRTRDGGETWDLIPVLAAYTNLAEWRTFKDFYMHKSGLGVLLYHAVREQDPDEYLNIRDSIMLTRDDWASAEWVNISQSEYKLTPWIGFIPDSNTIYVICRIDDLECMLLAKSTDKGTTWTNIRLPNDPFLAGIYFVDDKRGWVGGAEIDINNRYKSVIYYTSDGGNTWELQLDDTTSGISVLHFTDENNGFALGNSRHVIPVTDPNDTDLLTYRTKDGGKHWVRELNDTLGWRIGYEYALSVGSPKNAFIVIGSSLFRYDDDCTLTAGVGASSSLPEEVKLYPNPLPRGVKATIEGAEAESINEVILYDIYGNDLTSQLAYSISSNGNLEFGLEDSLAAGTYVVYVSYASGRAKFCKVVRE